MPKNNEKEETTANKLERLANEDTKLVNKWPLDTSNKRKPSIIIKWKWSRWSDWSECDCGAQKRKRVCIAKRSRKLSDVFDENGQRNRDSSRPSACDNESKQQEVKPCKDPKCSFDY